MYYILVDAINNLFHTRRMSIIKFMINKKTKKNAYLKIENIKKILLIIFILSLFSFLLYIFTKTFISEKLYRGDAIYYYNLILHNKWMNRYALEPLMGVIVKLFLPNDFAHYLVVSNIIPLFIILYSAYIANMSKTGIFILGLFFTISYYGMHYIFNFQRQYYAISFLIAFVASRRKIIFLLLAQFSHIYAIVPSILLYKAYISRKKQKTILIFLFIAISVLLYLLLPFIEIKTVQDYAQASNDNPFKFIIRSIFQLIFIGTIVYFIGGLKRISIPFKLVLVIYITLLCLSIIPVLGAVLVRIDYYIFSIIIFLILVEISNIQLKKIKRYSIYMLILIYSFLGFFQWLHSNAQWIFYGIS